MKRLFLPFFLNWISCGIVWGNLQGDEPISDDEFYEMSLSERMTVKIIFSSLTRLEISANRVAIPHHQNSLDMFRNRKGFKMNLFDRGRDDKVDSVFFASIHLLKDAEKRAS